MSDTTPHNAGLLRWLVFVIVVIDAVGFGIVIPILPFLSPALGGSALDIALIMVVYSVGAGLVGPFWGRLSDRIGRRWVLVLCLLGGVVGYGVLATAAALWQVYVARALAGLVAGNFPVATALMADLSSPAQRARAMGLIGAAFGVGLVLGPLVGGVLAGDDGAWALPALFAAAMSLLAAGLAWRLLPAGPPARDPDESAMPPREGLRGMVRRDRSGLLVLQFVLHTWAVTSAIYLVPLWSAALLNWGPHEVGVFFGCVGVAMVVFQGGLAHWLIHRLGRLPVLRMGSLIFAASAVGAGVADTFWSVVLLGLSAFAGSTLALPVLNTIASEVVAARERGSMMGLTASAAALGRVIGPLVSGWVLATSGFPAAWGSVGLVLLVLLLWSFTDGRRYTGAAAHPSPASASSS